jgi:hypothetical protein
MVGPLVDAHECRSQPSRTLAAELLDLRTPPYDNQPAPVRTSPRAAPRHALCSRAAITRPYEYEGGVANEVQRTLAALLPVYLPP